MKREVYQPLYNFRSLAALEIKKVYACEYRLKKAINVNKCQMFQ